MASYLTYLWAQYGDPLFFFKASAAWGRSFHSPLDTFLNYLRGPLVLYDWPYSWLDLILMIAMVVLLVVGWRLVPLSYWAYSGSRPGPRCSPPPTAPGCSRSIR